MKRILTLLKKYNFRHSEYFGLAGISIVDDGSGHLTDMTDRRIPNSNFGSIEELEKLLESG